MFTGLVQNLATVVETQEAAPGKRLLIRVPEFTEVELGESIAVNGCCLTVVGIDATAGTLEFDVGPETLVRTNLGELIVGAGVNLERSLRVGDRLGGHYVTGHIDGIGYLNKRLDEGEWSNFWFHSPPELTRQMVPKGSIAVDGVSLTLMDVGPEQFSVMLIPHTLAATTLGTLRPGDKINLETDILAKYAQKALTPLIPNS